MNNRDWARPVPVSTKTEEKVRTSKLDSRKVEREGWTDELRYLPHASSGFPVVFLGSSWIPLTPFDALL